MKVKITLTCAQLDAAIASCTLHSTLNRAGFPENKMNAAAFRTLQQTLTILRRARTHTHDRAKPTSTPPNPPPPTNQLGHLPFLAHPSPR